MGFGMMRRHRDAAAKKVKEAAKKAKEVVETAEVAEVEEFEIDLHKMTKKELISMAEKKEIEVDESMKKDELIEALSKEG